MTDGPFTDEFVKHGLLTVQTQRGIIEYAEGMAQILAEAGRASQKATGDRAIYAAERWSKIILDRAKEILSAEEKERNIKTRKKFEKLLAKS